jgi:hypothetical protein
LEFGLLSKEDSLENFTNIVAFINHPNHWIRDAVAKFVECLSDPKRKILSSAEVYCLVRPEVKKYKKQGGLPENLSMGG